MTIQTLNPATEEILEIYNYDTKADYESKIEKSIAAFEQWKTSSFDTRCQLMTQMGLQLKKNKIELAQLMACEMGKPVTAGEAEIEKCALVCEHYVEHAENYLAFRTINTESYTARIYHKPLGVIFGIMPWNFPFWQVFRFAVPTLMAGNSVLLKHASISTGSAIRIHRLFYDSGFLPDLFQYIITDGDGAANIISNPKVAAVTLTGGEKSGSSVAERAGACLKKSMLELGGSDPYIVLEDADLDLAAQCIVDSRLNNSGQVCVAAKRVIALESIKNDLLIKIKNYLQTYKVGNPLDYTTQMGPLARADLRETLHKQVENSIKQGAKLLLGGIIPDGQGFFYPPTLITDVEPGMAAFDEELFGPIVAVTTVKNEQDAIALANLSNFGLGAALFTRDLEKGERIAAHEIESGVCFVNALVASDPKLPFGGIKRSGYGRELSQEGILEFVNTKTVAINNSK